MKLRLLVCRVYSCRFRAASLEQFRNLKNCKVSFLTIVRMKFTSEPHNHRIRITSDATSSASILFLHHTMPVDCFTKRFFLHEVIALAQNSFRASSCFIVLDFYVFCRIKMIISALMLWDNFSQALTFKGHWIWNRENFIFKMNLIEHWLNAFASASFSLKARMHFCRDHVCSFGCP